MVSLRRVPFFVILTFLVFVGYVIGSLAVMLIRG